MITTLAPSVPPTVSARQTDEVLDYVFPVSWMGGGECEGECIVVFMRNSLYTL